MANPTDKSHGLQADPVPFKVAQNGIYCLDPAMLSLTLDEAQQLCDAINKLLSGDDISLCCDNNPLAWRCRVNQQPHLSTTPLHKIINKEISPYLPRGEDAVLWRQRMTEIQMLLHTHPVNQQRQQQELLTVDSVWFWRRYSWWPWR